MEQKPVDSPRASTRYVTFSAGERHFALAFERVCTITRYDAVRPVAHAPDYIRGVTVEGGRVVPVVDVGLKLGLEPLRDTPHACVIIVRTNNGAPAGLAVDDVGPIVDGVACSRARARRADDPPPPEILDLDGLLDAAQLARVGKREAASYRAGASRPAK